MNPKSIHKLIEALVAKVPDTDDNQSLLKDADEIMEELRDKQPYLLRIWGPDRLPIGPLSAMTFNDALRQAVMFVLSYHKQGHYRDASGHNLSLENLPLMLRLEPTIALRTPERAYVEYTQRAEADQERMSYEQFLESEECRESVDPDYCDDLAPVDIRTATFVELSELVPAGWEEWFYGAISQGAPFTYGDNNRTLVTASRFADHVESMIDNYADEVGADTAKKDAFLATLESLGETYIDLEH